MAALEKVPLYGVDTMLFVYHFESHPQFGPAAAAIFRGAEEGLHELTSSVLSLMEVLVLPKRQGRRDLVRQYREIFESFPNLTVHPIDTETVEIASELRAEHGLRTPDSLHVATAVRCGAQAFLSNDAELKKKVTEIPVLTPSEVAAQLLPG
jgi:predicted nucleic acid-binding protein